MVLFIVLILIGAFLGAADGGVLIGAAAGFLIAWVHKLSGKMNHLESQLKHQAQLLKDTTLSEPVETHSTAQASPEQTDWLSSTPDTQSVQTRATEAFDDPLADINDANIETESAPLMMKANPTSDDTKTKPTSAKPVTKSVPKEPPKPTIATKAIEMARDWFIGGNPFVRAGIVLLFIGMVFLLRYSLERGLIPVELRLAGAAATALVLLFFGWRLRERAGAYGLILQAGGIGLLYLTVFGAFSLYQLIPSTIAFGLLVMVVAAGVLLAVLQNSLSLAMFATAGGFLAPLLTSTGSNNYIGLFSFYALLNIGIVTISWFKSWRLLNLLGFVFTFVIASLWGMDSYQPEFFSTTEPFLILFFLIYVVIAVLFAIRTPVNFKDKVDSTLVFGVPVIGFAMQVALVQDFEYGVAISALVLGVFYLLLSRGLWKRYGKPQQLLAETFLSLGVIFATLSVPFAVDGALTSATWAIEGVGILWVSIRQQQWIRRAFAIFLHFAALGALIYQAFLNLFYGVEASPFANGDFVALLLITTSMLVCSRLLSRDFEGKRPYEKVFSGLLFFIPVALQWAAFEWEIVRFDLLDSVMKLHLVYAAIISTLLIISTRFKTWNLVRYILPFGLFISGIALLKLIETGDSLTAGHGVWLWPLAIIGLYATLYLHQQKERFSTLLAGMHSAAIWLVAILLSREVYHWMAQQFGPFNAWYLASLPLVGLAIIWLTLRAKVWPIADYRDTLIKTVTLPFAGLSALWVLASLTSAGSPDPLPWIPVLNPLDIVVVFVGLTLYMMHRQLSPTGLKSTAEMMRYATIFIIFAAINITVLRVLHHYSGYAWKFPDLLQEPVTQTTLAIVWTLFGMILAWRGNRTFSRNLWFAGSALLALVVLKLFVVDFASSGTLERVISFLSVGGLLLFIGYLAPMPSVLTSNDKGAPTEGGNENGSDAKTASAEGSKNNTIDIEVASSESTNKGASDV